jgi:hypothetical protein
MSEVMYKKGNVKVADELFIVLALLHQEQPNKEAFDISEILDRARKEGLGEARDQRSLRLHAYEHAAANVPPRAVGGRYRMVFRQRDNRIRLLSPADYVDPDRHQKFYPNYEEVPAKYHELLDWAKQRCERGRDAGSSDWLQGLHRLKGLGKEIWRGVDPDAYVRSLRED